MTHEEWMEKFNVKPREPERPRFSADDECRVCRGAGYSDCDGVFGTCWACHGSGARGAATTGPYLP